MLMLMLDPTKISVLPHDAAFVKKADRAVALASAR
jgi:hypothetical protein